MSAAARTTAQSDKAAGPAKVNESMDTDPTDTELADTESTGPAIDEAGGPLQTQYGTTTIASGVVAKIAALATQEIPGVQAMGKTLTRTIGTLRAKVPGAGDAVTQGVSVEVGERQAAIDVDIVVYYGQSIIEIADAIRENVIDRIEGMTGLSVVEVNVSVNDLFLEGDDAGDDGAPRVE